MPIRPTRVMTTGRGSSWGYCVLGAQGETLASRWHFRSEEAARQAGIAASLAISSTSITMSQGPQRINRRLPQEPKPVGGFGSWFSKR